MKIVLFIHKNSINQGTVLKDAIDKNISGRPEIIETLDALKSKLKKSFFNEHEVFILLADSKKRLNDLCSLQDLLENKCIILITPDESKYVISKVSQLFPRFFTPVRENYNDLCSVVDNLIRKKHDEQYYKGGYHGRH